MRKKKLKKSTFFFSLSFFSASLTLNTDFAEVPICESVISCDNLICDAYGKPPNASIVVQVTSSNGGWIKYGRTEVIEVLDIKNPLIKQF